MVQYLKRRVVLLFKYSELIKDNIKYKASLITLWAIIGLSLANIITTIMWRAHAGFSFYLTKIFADFSRDYIINNENMPKEILIVVITACTVLPYVVCALFYKKRPLYAIIALGLLVVDSAMFCIDFVVYLLIGNVMSLIDFVIRVAACVILLMYVMEGRDLWYTVKDADSLEEIFGTISEAEALAESEIEVNVNVRKIVISRKSEMFGFLANCEIFVDGESAGFIRSGQTRAIDVSVSAHSIMVISQNGNESEETAVENGKENVVFIMSVKPKLFAPAMPVLSAYEVKEN